MRDKSTIQQGKGILKLLLLCMFLCTMPQQTMAQSDVQRSDSDDSKFKAEDFGFNAIDIEQKRFLYGDSAIYNKEFHDLLSVGVTWRYNRIQPYGDYYKPALNYGIFVEKELSKLHALRLSLGGGSYQRVLHSNVVNVLNLNLCQVELLHSFNWVRFFGGYNPYRKVEVVTNLGIGGFYSTIGFNERFSKDNIEIGAQLTAGAGVRLLLNPLFVLGIEPYVTLANDNIDHSIQKKEKDKNDSESPNHRAYDVLYGTNISLSYTFRKELEKEEREKYHGNTLVDFGLGAQFQLSSGYLPNSLVATSLQFLETAGPAVRLGIGHWLSKTVAIRATANLSSSSWINTHIEADPINHHPSYNIHARNVLMNTHLDLLFSPYRFFTGREDNRFDVNTVVGWGYGRIIKSSYETPVVLRTNYNGFSGGLLLRYFSDEHTSLYIEPRITAANYTIPYASPYEDKAEHYRDYLFSVTAGMEFTANEYSFSNRSAQPSEFTPHTTVSLQGGLNHLFTTREHAGDSYLDYSGALAVERSFSPYSGVRLMVDYSQISFRDIYRYTQIGKEEFFGSQPILSDTALCVGSYGYINVSADYLFDLGTLLQGYNKDSKWDIALAIGLVSSHRVSYKAIISADEDLWEFRGENPVASIPEVDHSRVSKHAFGAQLGIPVSYRIAPRLELQFEPRARLFGSNYVVPGYITGGLSKIINLQLGMKYTF